MALSNRNSAVADEVWHRRLAHQNLDLAMQGMIKKAFTGFEVQAPTWGNPMAISEIMEQVCRTYAMGRQHKEAMRGMRQMTGTLLEYIHSDICGPMQTPALTGERDFTTFIDEASECLAVALLKTKGEVFDNFVLYRQRVEEDTGKEIKHLRSDGGGYMNAKFLTYLRNAGIVKQTTNLYSPAQNGIAERANRTLMEGAHCMLTDAGIGNEFWGFAVLTTAYIL